VLSVTRIQPEGRVHDVGGREVGDARNAVADGRLTVDVVVGRTAMAVSVSATVGVGKLCGSVGGT